MQTIILLILSNIFMTFAWYGHLKFREVALWQVIVISWLIALPEYALQVPANRIGYQKFSAIQLKTMQEVISLIVFCGFSILYLHEKLRWNHLIAFVLIVIATFLVFKK